MSIFIPINHYKNKNDEYKTKYILDFVYLPLQNIYALLDLLIKITKIYNS